MNKLLTFHLMHSSRCKHFYLAENSFFLLLLNSLDFPFSIQRDRIEDKVDRELWERAVQSSMQTFERVNGKWRWRDLWVTATSGDEWWHFRYIFNRTFHWRWEKYSFIIIIFKCISNLLPRYFSFAVILLPSKFKTNWTKKNSATRFY